MESASVQTRNLEATEVFRKEFHGYQKMTTSDYLEHSLLFGNIKEVLKSKNRRLRILDLGCGDAGRLSKLLAEIPDSVSSYTGVDMSESAIGNAQKLLHDALGADFPIFLHVSDMLSFLEKDHSNYDVVLAAFALHHLTSDDKIQCMKEVQRLLKSSSGVFIMVDPFRRVGESLQAYRNRASEVGETWVDMGREEQLRFIKHMQEYDIVEEESFFDNASKQAGFSHKGVICRGKKGLQSNVTVFYP